METQVDLQGSYSFNLGGNRRLTLSADAFNLFNIRRTLDFNAATEMSFFDRPNPDFGTFGASLHYQPKRAPSRTRSADR